MSATITPRRGTPFDQLAGRPVPRVVPRPVVVKPAPRPVAVRRITPPVVPQRSADQRMSALDEANRVRLARVALKRDIKAGGVLAVDVLADPPEWALTMKAVDLLLAVPRCGKVKAERLLRSADASLSKTLGGLTGRQRGELVALLGGER